MGLLRGAKRWLPLPPAPRQSRKGVVTPMSFLDQSVDVATSQPQAPGTWRVVTFSRLKTLEVVIQRIREASSVSL